MFLFTASVASVLFVPRQNFLYRWLEACLFWFILAILIIGVPGFGRFREENEGGKVIYQVFLEERHN